MNHQRKLVTVRKITHVRRLRGQYKAYDVVTVGDGWTVVVYHNDFYVGEFVLYFEIDSFIPSTSGRFRWEDSRAMIEFQGERGYHVRSQMLGKQISQGLVQPIGALPGIKEAFDKLLDEHGREQGLIMAQNMAFEDVVGVKKWELPFEAHGKVLGRAPTFFHRPACERAQNVPGLFYMSKYLNLQFQVTEKIDGVSMTVYRVSRDSQWCKSLPILPTTSTQQTPTARIGVASAGEDLDEQGNDVYWQAAKLIDLPTKIHEIGIKNVAVQGELIGPTIKNNSLRFAENANPEFKIFQIFDIDKQEFMNAAQVVKVCENLGLPHVPVLGYVTLGDFAKSLGDILAMADGVGSHGQTREGFVLKSMSTDFDFKVISNKWLLEQGE